ncbi:hypothetical protein F2P81_002662 [Scophthalmus maximus]|uniref:Uncharacterized protein n=1 Tax=Scophthalmus maximus TaxID=52904 RepID=A0A6A4TJD5_SCOMX|nr:hypothetical protein F2P81_002662 [Scophthalmus maximus]
MARPARSDADRRTDTCELHTGLSAFTGGPCTARRCPVALQLFAQTTRSSVKKLRRDSDRVQNESLPCRCRSRVRSSMRPIRPSSDFIHPHL